MGGDPKETKERRERIQTEQEWRKSAEGVKTPA